MSTKTKNQNNDDVITITPSDMSDIIQSHNDRLDWQLANRGHRRGLTTPFFLALPGVGKSEISLFVSEQLGRKFFDVRAGNCLPSDLRIPAVDKEAEIARYFGNTELPFVTNPEVTEGDSILMLWDELLDASLPVQRVLKQAMNDNCIGNISFPENTLHIACANGLDHGCMSERLPLSNANRMAFYNVRPDLNGFQEWLSDIGLYPELEAFLQSNSDVPYDMDVSKWDGKSNFASFRTLEEFGKLINTDLVEIKGGARYLKPIDSDNLLLVKISAVLGHKAAHKALEYLKIYEAVGSIQNLLDDPQGCTIPSSLTKKWIVACKLAGAADQGNVSAVMTVAERLSSTSGGKGFMATYVAKSICKQKPKLSSTKAIKKWMGDNFMDLVGRG